MIIKIFINLILGLLIGCVLEFIYRSIVEKRIVLPKIVNIQMYGLTGMFLVVVYYLNIHLIYKMLMIFVFPTIVEFLTGYLYLKIRKIYLWNYSNYKLNFMGLICLRFSVTWFVVSILYYYIILPLTLK